MTDKERIERLERLVDSLFGFCAELQDELSCNNTIDNNVFDNLSKHIVAEPGCAEIPLSQIQH